MPPITPTNSCRKVSKAGCLTKVACWPFFTNWSAAFALGTPVDPQIGPVTFTPVNNPADPSGTFSWPSWTSASYPSIQYSCGNGSGDPLFPADTSQGGQCVALVPPGQDPLLTIVVSTADGSSYTIQYDRNGNVR